MRILTFVMLLSLMVSCKKDTHKYAEAFVGLYESQVVGHNSHTFVTQITLVGGNVISIRTNWHGGNSPTFPVKAKVEGRSFVILSQTSNGARVQGVGNLYSGSALVIEYEIDRVDRTIIGQR